MLTDGHRREAEPLRQTGRIERPLGLQDLHNGPAGLAFPGLPCGCACHAQFIKGTSSRRPVEQRGGQHVQRVEPAAGLPVVLDDEVARVMGRRTIRGSRTGSAPGRTASSRTRTSSPAPPAPGASSSGRSGRPGWPGSARRSSAGAGRWAARRSRARARPASRRRRPAGRSDRRDIQTGIGDPQNRFREIDQSLAPSSHLPNWPSLMCAGTQLICWFSSTIRSRNRVTATNQDDTARWISGVSQRQQCGYGCS